MLIWPYNYIVLASAAVITYGLSYEIVQNWFEGWATSNMKARAIQFVQCGLEIGALAILYSGSVMTLIYLGGELDWIFYAQTLIAIALMMLGLMIAQAMKQNLKPSGLKKAKRAR
jgi:hypothetical protein